VAIADLVQSNLLSPMVLAFVLGMAATLLRSDLKLPEELVSALSIYLLLAIGLKGGAALAQTTPGAVWAPALAALALGCLIPLIAYVVLRRLGQFSVVDAAALAAHYGSVSAVTFAATQTFLTALDVSSEGFMPALVAIMEVPAIVIALLIAQLAAPGAVGDRTARREALRELLTGKSIVLLVGGMLIGWLAGPGGTRNVDPFFKDLFQGALTLFLLELGMVAARRLRDLRKVGPFLIGFGLLMPIVSAGLGLIAAQLAGLSFGGAVVLAVLAASASYIAAPAAVRIALPQANPGYYLTAALAITFPFNLAVGIPLYYTLAGLLYGG
jgi:uncharacterized protein